MADIINLIALLLFLFFIILGILIPILKDIPRSKKDIKQIYNSPPKVDIGSLTHARNAIGVVLIVLFLLGILSSVGRSLLESLR